MKQSDISDRFTTWVEISRSALISNFNQFRAMLAGDVRLFPVVKANAYGHGIELTAPILIEAGAEGLAVNSVDEGIRLRRLQITAPVIVLGYTPLHRLAESVEYQLELTVYNHETVKQLESCARNAGKTASCHLKIETGTSRQGVLERDIAELCDIFRQSPFLHLKGLSTHFANIEDTTVHTYADQQKITYARLHNYVTSLGLKIEQSHIACTAAAILFPETHYNQVRIGIGIYGLWPSKETYLSAVEHKQNSLRLTPVMTWKTRVAQVKWLPADTFVGYGCTWRTTRRTRIAVLPVGYYEGYDRRLSNQAYVLIRGRRAPVRGRVCMNLCMVDVSDIPDVALETEVVLLGQQENERLSADQVASWIGTINYEVVTRISEAIPRILVS